LQKNKNLKKKIMNKRIYSALACIVALAACGKQNINPADSTGSPGILQQTEITNNTAGTLLARVNNTKAGVLAYISGMAANSQVISGQQCGDGDAIAADYGTFMDGLFNLSGKYPAICGADYGWKVNNLNTINQKLISHWNAGGFVEISWHADNPFANGYEVRFNSVKNKRRIKLNTLLKNAGASTAKTNYRNELATIAGALQSLRDAGVVVIWRPFHEMNGDWFWWGINAYNNTQTNTQEYKDLWIDLYNTLTVDYGLNNLIWVYSPATFQGWNGDVTSYYPGSPYVDLTGEDVYSAQAGLPDYTALQTLGKPVVLAECGPDAAAYGNYNEVTLVNNIKGKACFFLQWHSWPGAAVAIKDNLNYSPMMNSADVITRDEVQ
jgi:mannan endo-1,4-beta-mannosidase